MNQIAFDCPCGQILQAPEWQQGLRARCPTCRGEVLIPGSPPDPGPAGPIPLSPCPACAEAVPRDARRCPQCGERTDGMPPAPSRATRWHAYRDRPSLPWSDPSRGTLPLRLVSTWKAFVAAPATAFRSVDPAGSFGQAYLFSLAMTMVSTLAGALSILGLVALTGTGMAPVQAVATTAILAGIQALAGALRPFLNGLVLHLALLVTGGARRPLEATLQVACYAHGATCLPSAIPVAGWMVDLVWTMGLQAVGLREVHEIGGARALVATMLPGLVVVGCCASCAGLPAMMP